MHSQSQSSLKLFSCISILLFLLPILAFAGEAQVKKIHDGDTIKAIWKGREVNVRFYGIDCPEKDQPYGMQAKKYVSEMIRGRDVEVEPTGQPDKYGRVLGLVYVDGKLLNEALIINGLAWVYDRYCHKRVCDKWNRLERQARRADTGLWSASNPIPPWEWRHSSRE